jgi:hypothetical protein
MGPIAAHRALSAKQQGRSDGGLMEVPATKVIVTSA